MGKRGRPPKKKVLPEPVPKEEEEECYTILSSDEDAVDLPSPAQRRGTRNERNKKTITTPSNRKKSLIDDKEKPTPTRNGTGIKKKIVLNGLKKKDDASGDSDATEVYVHCLLLFINN